jgi:hypothetical protein
MNERIQDILALSICVTFGCIVPFTIGLLESRPPQVKEGEITLEAKIKPRKPKNAIGVGRDFISFDELDAGERIQNARERSN